MNTSAIIHRNRCATMHFIKLPATLPVTFSVMDSTQKQYTGYFAALAHEVRNPLCNINLACDALNLTNAPLL